MRFKEGDRVRVRNMAALSRSHASVDIQTIRHLAGTAVTISGVHSGYYKVYEDDVIFYDHYFEGYDFKYGEIVEALWRIDGVWSQAIYVGYIDGCKYPYMLVDSSYEKAFRLGDDFLVTMQRTVRPLEQDSDAKLLRQQDDLQDLRRELQDALAREKQLLEKLERFNLKD